MIVIIHGNNINSSRSELGNYKTKNSDKEIITLDGNTASETDLIQALETTSLFEKNKLIILENFISKNKIKTFFSFLNKNSAKNIIIWENKEITKTNLSKIPKDALKFVYNFPQIIYQFLDSFTPQNYLSVLDLYKCCRKTMEPEQIFYLLVRHLRCLIMVKENPDEIKSLPYWKVKKLTNQAKFFTMEKLLHMYSQFFEIDCKIKTLNTKYNLDNYLIQQIILSLNLN